ncbi:hypothetical protein WJX79_004739 [Trebouxia sp. C0005]
MQGGIGARRCPGALSSAHSVHSPLCDRTPSTLPACDRGPHKSKHIAAEFISGMTDKSNFVGLNVGGRIFLTSHSTLTRDPNSMLARMFTETIPPSCQDKNGHYIIDRDGDTFKYILNYLRDGSCVFPVNYYTRAELLREADYYQLAGLSQQLRRTTTDLNSTSSSAAAALLVPDASSQKLMVLESLRSEAGIENIAAAERALLAVAYGTDDVCVMAKAALAAKYEHMNSRVLNCFPFAEDTKVVAMEASQRVIALSLEATGDVSNYPLLEEDYAAHGAHCTGHEFAKFVWRYQQVLQHDMLLLDYIVTVEKGMQTFEQRNCGVFWVTISLDVDPPSPKRKHSRPVWSQDDEFEMHAHADGLDAAV